MKMQVYAVRDTVTEKFGPPWLAENDQTATRTYVQSLKKQTFPRDLELYLLGEMDETTGKLEPVMIGKSDMPVLISDIEIIEKQMEETRGTE